MIQAQETFGMMLMMMDTFNESKLVLYRTNHADENDKVYKTFSESECKVLWNNEDDIFDIVNAFSSGKGKVVFLACLMNCSSIKKHAGIINNAVFQQAFLESHEVTKICFLDLEGKVVILNKRFY